MIRYFYVVGQILILKLYSYHSYYKLRLDYVIKLKKRLNIFKIVSLQMRMKFYFSFNIKPF